MMGPWRWGRRPEIAPAFLPDQTQELLLRAALMSGPAALDAWRAFQTLVAFDDIDGGSRRLLPLVHRNLRDRITDEPAALRLRESYLRTWHANRLAFEALAPVLDALRRAGIRAMLLKGAALAVRYYGDAGLRPMADCDVMVPADQAGQAAEVLMALGWTAWPERAPSQFTAASQWFVHAWHFAGAGRQHLDLHWHLGPECCNAAADEDFWAAAVPFVLNRQDVWLLAPCDQLFHVCLHGAEASTVPPLRWVADAIVILRTPDASIDWHRLLRLAATHRVVRPLELTLGYLRAHHEAPVPAWVLEALGDLPQARIEAFEFRNRNRPPPVAETFDGLLRWWGRVWWRHVDAVGLPAAVAGLPLMLQEAWGLDSPWAVPGEATTRLWRRLRRRRRD